VFDDELALFEQEFKAVDREGRGYVDRQAVRTIIGHFIPNIQDATFEAMIKEMDCDGINRITPVQFIHGLTNLATLHMKHTDEFDLEGIDMDSTSDSDDDTAQHEATARQLDMTAAAASGSVAQGNDGELLDEFETDVSMISDLNNITSGPIGDESIEPVSGYCTDDSASSDDEQTAHARASLKDFDCQMELLKQKESELLDQSARLKSELTSQRKKNSEIGTVLTHTLNELRTKEQDDVIAAAALDVGERNLIEQIPEDIKHATANYKLAVDHLMRALKEKDERLVELTAVNEDTDAHLETLLKNIEQLRLALEESDAENADLQEHLLEANTTVDTLKQELRGKELEGMMKIDRNASILRTPPKEPKDLVIGLTHTGDDDDLFLKMHARESQTEPVPSSTVGKQQMAGPDAETKERLGDIERLLETQHALVSQTKQTVMQAHQQQQQQQPMFVSPWLVSVATAFVAVVLSLVGSVLAAALRVEGAVPT